MLHASFGDMAGFLGAGSPSRAAPSSARPAASARPASAAVVAARATARATSAPVIISTKAIQADPRSVSRSLPLPPTAEQKAAAEGGAGAFPPGSFGPDGMPPAEGAVPATSAPGEAEPVAGATAPSPSAGSTAAGILLTGALFLVSGWAAYKLYNADDR